MNGYVIPFINFHYPYFSSGSQEEEGYFGVLDLALYPLFKALECLENDGIDYCVSISLSAAFTHLLANEKINRRYCERIRTLQAEETRNERRDALRDTLFWMDQYQYQPLWALRRLASYGHLEIITGTATNAPLPLLAPVPEAVKAQITVALAIHKHFFDHECQGIFLNPVCCYPQLPQLLKEIGVQYAIVAPMSSSRQNEITEPLLTNSGSAVVVANPSLSTTFCEALTSEWQKADEMANQCMTTLQNAKVQDNRENKSGRPVFLMFADALQLLGDNRTKKLNTLFLELLLRKISCDQKELILEKTSSYLADAKSFLEVEDLSFLAQNLTQFYQAGYQQLFPDLHLAALKLLKFAREEGTKRTRSEMVKELLLAQCGDHRPHEDSYCRNHLQKFTAIINGHDEIVSKETMSNLNNDDDGFLSSIDLSIFY